MPLHVQPVLRASLKHSPEETVLKIQELCTESHHGHDALSVNGDAVQSLPHHGDAQHQPVLIILLDVT